MWRKTAVVLCLVLGVPSTAANPAAAADGGFQRTVDITFPVSGRVTFTDTYHADRGGSTDECGPKHGRKHQATDLMGAKFLKVHAAQSGVVTWAPRPQPSYGWMISIRGDDGLTYSYVHLNNDSPGTDNGKGGAGWAYAPGIGQGVRVKRGQFIGYLGDSGNAESTPAHLHFEIYDPELSDKRLRCPYVQGRLNPYPSLVSAQQRGDLPPRRVSGFTDVRRRSRHAPAILAAVAERAVRPCGPRRYCPGATVTRAELATALRHAMGLRGRRSGVTFSDVPRGTAHRRSINRMVARGIMRGCGNGRFCPDRPVKRRHLAVLLKRALDVPGSRRQRFADVPPGAPRARAINRMAKRGVMRGCGDGNFCPTAHVRRRRLATELDRAFHLAP